VHSALHLLRGLMPERFEDCPRRLEAFAERLGVSEALVALRAIAADLLCSSGNRACGSSFGLQC
jgi:hypothetical protein